MFKDLYQITMVKKRSQHLKYVSFHSKDNLLQPYRISPFAVAYILSLIFQSGEVCSVEEEIDRIYEMCYLFSSKYEDLYLHDSASFKLEFS